MTSMISSDKCVGWVHEEEFKPKNRVLQWANGGVVVNEERSQISSARSRGAGVSIWSDRKEQTSRLLWGPGGLLSAFVFTLSFLAVPFGLSETSAQSVIDFGFGSIGSGGPSVLEVDTVWSQDAARPGDRLVLAVVLGIQAGWHVNADAAQILASSDFKPIATTLEVAVGADGLAFGRIHYPEAHELDADYGLGPMHLKVFEGRTVFFVPVTVANVAESGARLVHLELRVQACDDRQCLAPKTIPVQATLAVVGQEIPVELANQELFAGYQPAGASAQMGKVEDPSDFVPFEIFGAGFSLNASTAWGFVGLLLTAALGGLLLNFTPCVLPVIPIKIIGLSQVAGTRGRCLLLGATMSAGVVAFWFILGAAIALVGTFTATSQLFQYPTFTITVGLVIALMAVGMCGLFTLRLPQFVYRINPKQDTIIGSIGFGIMTAILSTPCTAPFMGSAAAWAAGQQPAVTMATFVAIGAGMALPYLLLSSSPGLVEKMPRTGPASALIKQVMGLLMLAAAAYFVGTGLVAIFKSPIAPASRLYWWPVATLVAAAGLWLAVRTVGITRSGTRRLVFGAAGGAFVVAAGIGGVTLTDKGPIDWVHYTADRFADRLSQGQVVVLDFTAEWCLNCKVLEHMVLHDRRVVSVLAQEDVVPMMVDITTRKNVEGYRMLNQVGSVNIPLLVVFAADGRVVHLKDEL